MIERIIASQPAQLKRLRGDGGGGVVELHILMRLSIRFASCLTFVQVRLTTILSNTSY